MSQNYEQMRSKIAKQYKDRINTLESENKELKKKVVADTSASVYCSLTFTEFLLSVSIISAPKLSSNCFVTIISISFDS